MIGHTGSSSGHRSCLPRVDHDVRRAGAAVTRSESVRSRTGRRGSLDWRLSEGELPRDRRDLGLGEEFLVVLDLPVEDNPHPVGVIGTAEDVGARGPVLLPLLGALR